MFFQVILPLRKNELYKNPIIGDKKEEKHYSVNK
jgi:hypothetical protein